MRTDLYTCPICGEKLIAETKSYYCKNRHCYDESKAGYVNLLPVNKKNSAFPGDNKDMIKARVDVMNNGYYLPLANEIISILNKTSPKFVLDAGCGTGYIPYKLKETFTDSEVIGTDISKYAIEYASKRYKNVAFAVASSVRLPFENGVFDALICAFAPVYKEEFARVLKKGGYFFRVVPAEKHLFNLKEFLYDEARINEDEPVEIQGFEFIEKRIIKNTLNLSGDVVESIIKMTPYYYHTPPKMLEKLKSLEQMIVETEFELRVYLIK